MIPGFADRVIAANGQTIAASLGQTIAASLGGSGPPLLLLHGFPQTRAMWAAIAPRLAARFTVIAADLRGYGGSSKPEGAENYTFRAMAADLLALMTALGHDRFHLAGHDRGARVAHRLALDAPTRPLSLALLDIVPTHRLLHPLDHRVARSYWHWFFLAQPAPFPESLILADPERFFTACLLGWGGARIEDFAPDQLAAYRAAWSDPQTVRAMCDDYRATLALDLEMDAADLGRRIEVPALVLYGADGAIARAFDIPATWAPHLARMQTGAIPGGHFFPDTAPEVTAAALLSFLTGGLSPGPAPS